MLRVAREERLARHALEFAMLVVSYALMGVLGAFAGNKVDRVSVKFRPLAPPVTACIGLATLFS